MEFYLNCMKDCVIDQLHLNVCQAFLNLMTCAFNNTYQSRTLKENSQRSIRENDCIR